MALFEVFKDTIFFKESSNLEKKIKALEEIQDKVKEKELLNRELKILKQGLNGEKSISFELKNANIGMYVMHDVNVAYGDIEAQIDYIIITPVHCYLVECKNLIGNVTVTKEGEFRREYFIDGVKRKEAIYSPYTQAIRHKEILKKIWSERKGKIATYFFEKEFDNYYKPLVVLANSSGLLNTKYAPKEIRDITIRVDNLIEYLKKDVEKYKKNARDSKDEMENSASNILTLHKFKKENYTEKYEIEQEETSEIEEKYEKQQEYIREKLLGFRKEKSYFMNVPAYYIFNNEELEKLLEHMPKNIEEFKKLKILEPIKVKCHGEEIIEIIKNSNRT